MTRITGFQILQSRINGLAEGDILRNVAYRELRRIWAEAASAFVKASVRRMLVETGMSAATFFPLSRAISALKLGVPGTVSEVQAAVNKKILNSVQDRPEFPRGARRRPTPRRRDEYVGAREGEKAYTLTFGSKNQPRFRFYFQTQVYQFAVMDAYERILATGEAAFLESLEANIGDVERVLTRLMNARRLPPNELPENVRF